MFCFFKNNELVNFWSNKIGDVFADLTCSGMKWNRAEVDLCYYPALDEVPSHYSFDSNKVLSILDRVITVEEIENEGGEISTIEVESFVVQKTIEPDIFMVKGVMARPC